MNCSVHYLPFYHRLDDYWNELVPHYVYIGRKLPTNLHPKLDDYHLASFVLSLSNFLHSHGHLGVCHLLQSEV
jgi:hypothetical protein